MKFNFKKIGLYSTAFFGLTLFSACFEENATEASEQAGMKILAEGDSLPECTNENVGEMFYVSDSSAAYYCGKEKWSILKGKDGKKGEDGIATEGNPGANCTASVVEDGIDIYCGNAFFATLKNGDDGLAVSGKDGNSCSAVQDKESGDVVITCETDDGKGVSYTIENGAVGKTAYELAKTDLSLDKWLESLKGEDGKNCSIKANDNGDSYIISCEGSDDVVVKNGTAGKSAYELAETDLSLDKWLESLKGEDGKNCSIQANEDGVSYTIKCTGSNDVIVKNGDTGNCVVSDDKNGKVVITCGEGKNALTATIFKGDCGETSFDPTTQFCHNGKAYFLCSQKAYNPTSQYCLTVKDGEGNEKSRVEALMVDNRNSQNEAYKTVIIEIEDYKETWMAENMKFNTNTENESNSWCREDDTDCKTYGRLYQWASANSACPDGWHLPSDIEWKNLIDAVGGESIAGKVLKSDFGWLIDQNANFWTSTKHSSDIKYAYTAQISYDERTLVKLDEIDNGYSVRCIETKATTQD